MIDLFVQKINVVENKEYNETKPLVDNYIKDNKEIKMTQHKKTKIEKRNYNESLQSLDEGSKQEIVKEEKEILSKYFAKKIKYETYYR